MTASIIPGGTKAVCDDGAGGDRRILKAKILKIISKLWRFLIAIGDVKHMHHGIKHTMHMSVATSCLFSSCKSSDDKQWHWNVSKIIL